VSIWLQFIASAAVVVFAASRLATYGDVIAVRTRLGGMFVGTLLLAAATSLPELLTTIASIDQAVPDLAAGNIFGSCMFNMFMLAILDVVAFQGRILRLVMGKHAISGTLAVLLVAVTVFFILADVDVGIGFVGFDSLILMVGYIGGVWLLNDNNPTQPPQPPLAGDKTDSSSIAPLWVALLGFGLATILLILITPIMVRSSASIAESTGVSAGFVGVTLVAVVTSLPELVTTIAAVRLGAFDLAIGNLFGSNCFNIFALGLTEFFYRQGRFLADIDEAMLLAAVLALLLTALGVFGNVTLIKRRLWIIEVDSVLMTGTYLFGMWLLYTRGLMV
jgi:cation:H+ antiporter